MPSVLVDANIFLELELLQSKAPECREFLLRVADGSITAATTNFVIGSVALVMEEKGSDPAEIRKFLASLLLYRGLSIHRLDARDMIAATYEMSRSGLGFDDATAVAAMRKMGIEKIVSFDRDLDKAYRIERVEPARLLK